MASSTTNSKFTTGDGKNVKCLLCKNDFTEMSLRVLRDVHLPNHFRLTLDKTEPGYSEYRQTFIATMTELCLAASKLQSVSDIDAMVDDVCNIARVNPDNFPGTKHVCKLCQDHGAETAVNTVWLMISHVSHEHIDDHSKKEDEETIKHFFQICFPDALFEKLKPFSLDDLDN